MTTDSPNIRALVLELLLAVLKDGEYSHIVRSAVLEKYQYLTKQERSFLTRLTEGVLERQIELDYIIKQNETANPLYPADWRLPAEIYGFRSGVCCL